MKKEVAELETKMIDRLYLELSQVSNAKTARELRLEKQIKEIASATSWAEQAAKAEIALADIENRKPEEFAIQFFEN